MCPLPCLRSRAGLARATAPEGVRAVSVSDWVRRTFWQKPYVVHTVLSFLTVYTAVVVCTSDTVQFSSNPVCRMSYGVLSTSNTVCRTSYLYCSSYAIWATICSWIRTYLCCMFPRDSVRFSFRIRAAHRTNISTYVRSVRSSAGCLRGSYELYSFVYSIPIVYTGYHILYALRSTRSSLEFSVWQYE
jgi:hypothetical protein